MISCLGLYIKRIHSLNYVEHFQNTIKYGRVISYFHIEEITKAHIPWDFLFDTPMGLLSCCIAACHGDLYQ